MTLSHAFMLKITAVLVIILCGVLFAQYGFEFLELIIQPALATLIALGKAIAGMAGVDNKLTGILVYVIGNILLFCLVLLSTGIYFLNRAKSRAARTAMIGLAFIVGFSLMVVQTGFCQGFPMDFTSETVRDIAKGLLALEGLMIAFAPLYYSQKMKAIPDYKDL